MKIFFSYGRDHYKTFIQKIKNDLISKYNLNIWIDSVELKTADPNGWERSIEEGIENCDRVIYFLTPHSTRRPDGYCEKEIRYSNIFKKTVIPVMVEKSIPPISICTVQYSDIQSLANSFDIKTESFLNKSIEEEYYKKLEEIYKVLQSNEVIFESNKKDIDLLDYLNPLDFNQDISKHLKNFVGREWLYKKVDDLLKNDSDRVLWITAEAGFGKTAFSTYLQHQHERAIGIHYCRYDSPKRKDPLMVLQTLIYQISTQIPEYKEILSQEKFKKKLEDLKSFKYHLHDILDEFLVQPLNKLIVNKNCFFIIDALDEALDNESNLFIDLIPKFNDLPSWLNIVITSRPEPYLKQKLSSLRTIEFDANLEQNNDDLSLFIENSINRINCQILKDKDISLKLIEKSEGNILYLKEVIDSIEKGFIDKNEIDDLPPTISGLYLNMFERYFSEIEYYEEKIMPIFELLCAANQSLSKELICDMLNIKNREFKKIMTSIGSLIEENEQGEIYFYHKSLSDWLIDEDLCSDDYFVDIEEAYNRVFDYLKVNYEVGKYSIKNCLIFLKVLNNIDFENELINFIIINENLLCSFKYRDLIEKYLTLDGSKIVNDRNNLFNEFDKLIELEKKCHNFDGSDIIDEIAGLSLHIRGDLLRLMKNYSENEMKFFSEIYFKIDAFYPFVKQSSRMRFWDYWDIDSLHFVDTINIFDTNYKKNNTRKYYRNGDYLHFPQ